MSSPDKQSIVVRVEVEIPGMGWGTTCCGPSFHVLDSKIGFPGATANVRVSGGVGYICATGKSKNAAGTAARTIYAKIYPVGTTLANIPAAPPAGTQATKPAADGSWAFNGEGLDVKGAASNDLGTAGNILVIWADYGTDPMELKAVSFLGKTNPDGKTDCTTGSGSGSGSGSSKAPREWRAIGEGFGGEASAFNIASLLRLQKDSRGQLVWTNGGNGETSPSIELRHVAESELWQLEFRYRELEFCYACPSTSWNPLNANTLELRDYKTGAEEAPRSLEITPV